MNSIPPSFESQRVATYHKKGRGVVSLFENELPFLRLAIKHLRNDPLPECFSAVYRKLKALQFPAGQVVKYEVLPQSVGYELNVLRGFLL